MKKQGSVLLAAVRLALVSVALVAIPTPGQADDEFGGCSPDETHACARTGEVLLGKACEQGTSGGCEDCVQADASYSCFYRDGEGARGYKPANVDE